MRTHNPGRGYKDNWCSRRSGGGDRSRSSHEDAVARRARRPLHADEQGARPPARGALPPQHKGGTPVGAGQPEASVWTRRVSWDSKISLFVRSLGLWYTCVHRSRRLPRIGTRLLTVLPKLKWKSAERARKADVPQCPPAPRHPV